MDQGAGWAHYRRIRYETAAFGDSIKHLLQESAWRTRQGLVSFQPILVPWPKQGPRLTGASALGSVAWMRLTRHYGDSETTMKRQLNPKMPT